MGSINKKIPEFPGFSVQYDPKIKPFFESQVIQELRRIVSKDLGRKLLQDIADARPRARKAGKKMTPEAQAVKFPKGINVVMVPTSMQYTQSGFKMAFTGVGVEKSLQASAHASHNVPGCPYHPAGGSCAEAADILAAGDKTGSVSIMKFTNAQILTSKGEATQPFIVLAHELIHSLHHVTGTRLDTGEEDWTTGLPPYTSEPMSENKIRAAFGLPSRQAY